MKMLRATLATAALITAIAFSPVALATQDAPPPAGAKENLSGLHDFDFLIGKWNVHHRRLKERLAGSHEWIAFDGTCEMHPLMDGRANVDDNVLRMPGGDYRGVGLRSYDAKTGQWAIWWLDGRSPFGPLDPPVKGRFVDGIGTFYAHDTLRGKPILVRFVWSNMTATTAHWEQAFSADGGKTWEVNWITDFRRKS